MYLASVGVEFVLVEANIASCRSLRRSSIISLALPRRQRISLAIFAPKAQETGIVSAEMIVPEGSLPQLDVAHGSIATEVGIPHDVRFTPISD